METTTLYPSRWLLAFLGVEQTPLGSAGPVFSTMRCVVTNERFELQLPLKSHYSSVLAATIGAIAGTISFPYDEIVQLRVAVSEVLTFMSKHMPLADGLPQTQDPTEDRLVVSFATEPGRILILMTCSADYRHRWDTEEWRESEALLGSLMDEVEYGIEGTGETVVRMAKRI